MQEQLIWMGWAIIYAIVGGVIGTLLVLAAGTLIPRLLDKLTPKIDEEKEILRGNRAVAEYFGRVVSAGIIGVSLVVAAAVLGALIAALHGG